MFTGSRGKSLAISITVALIAGLLMGGAVLAAQSATTKIRVEPRALTLGINPSEVDFGAAVRGETRPGNDIAVTVQSDLDFNVTIKGTDIGDIDKSNLQYKLDTDTNWNNLSGTAAILITGSGSHQEQQYAVEFQLNVPGNAPMGTQTGELTFDASTI